jgi:phospholipid/cholesterol/gamma-HCH transport system ATP-binding protein
VEFPVRLRGVRKAFGAQQVLRGVDLQVEAGTCTVLLGPSGCGKTVLLKIAAGLLPPDAGEAWLCGEPLHRLGREALADVWRRVGILFQGGALFDSLSVRENLELPLRERTRLSNAERQARIRETLGLLGLAGTEGRLPGELSGGMRKRVAFARAWVMRPDVLLVDEPTAGLDPFSTRAVASELLLARQQFHVTVLAITHDLNTAFRIADRLALLEEGRLLGDLPPHAFARLPHPAVQAFLRTWLQHHPAAGGNPPTSR